MDDIKFLELVAKIDSDPWKRFYLGGTIRDSDRDYPEADPPRLKSLGNARTMRGFCALLWQSLKILRPDLKFYPVYPDYVMDREGPITWSSSGQVQTTWMCPTHQTVKSTTPGKCTVQGCGKSLVPAASSPVVPDETITWTVLRQTPGSIGAQPFSNRRELRHRLRDIINVEGQTPETRSGGLLETYGQWMDNLVQFDIWTKDNSSAEDLTEWFKSFMLEYESIWYERGIQKILFWERLRDDTIFKWKNGLVSRSLQWFIRTEELTVKETPKIRAINVQLKKLEEHLLQHWAALEKGPKA